MTPHWLAEGWPDPGVAWLDHLRHGGRLDRATHDAELAELRHVVEVGPPAELARRLQRLAVPWPPPPGDEAPPAEPHPLGTREVARVALDFAPAAGDDGPAVVLGPWADVLDVRHPGHVRAWAASVAWAAFLLHDELRPPARAWCRDGARRPPEAERRRLQAVGRAPPVPWRLVPSAGGLRVRPLVAIGEAWVPDGPVDLSEVGGVDGPPRVGGLLLGRVLATAEGPRAVAAVALPVAPHAAVVGGWFARLALPCLVAERHLGAEELLRRVGHRLSGALHAGHRPADRTVISAVSP